MGKAKKLFDEWGKNVPAEARKQDIITFLNAYFPGMWDQKGSSHIVIRCDKLKVSPDYQPYGELTIPVKGGQKVKGIYIKKLFNAANLLEGLKKLNEAKHEKGSELFLGVAIQNRDCSNI